MKAASSLVGGIDRPCKALLIWPQPLLIRHVLVDDVGGDLKRHPAIGVLLCVLPESSPGNVETLGRGDGVDEDDWPSPIAGS
jgi:hypothetical protein